MVGICLAAVAVVVVVVVGRGSITSSASADRYWILFCVFSLSVLTITFYPGIIIKVALSTIRRSYLWSVLGSQLEGEVPWVKRT